MAVTARDSRLHPRGDPEGARDGPGQRLRTSTRFTAVSNPSARLTWKTFRVVFRSREAGWRGLFTTVCPDMPSSARTPRRSGATGSSTLRREGADRERPVPPRPLRVRWQYIAGPQPQFIGGRVRLLSSTGPVAAIPAKRKARGCASALRWGPKGSARAGSISPPSGIRASSLRPQPTSGTSVLPHVAVSVGPAPRSSGMGPGAKLPAAAEKARPKGAGDTASIGLPSPGGYSERST